jgi:hypothetical protein
VHVLASPTAEQMEGEVEGEAAAAPAEPAAPAAAAEGGRSEGGESA